MSEKTIQYSKSAEALLGKLNVKWVARLKSAKDMATRIALFQGYDIQTQEEEQIIQFFLDKVNPPRPSITKESLVRLELERAEANGEQLDTPEAEKVWQDKIDAAAVLDKKDQIELLKGHFLQIQAVLGDMVTAEDFFGDLADDIMNMSGEKSITIDLKKNEKVIPPLSPAMPEELPETVLPESSMPPEPLEQPDAPESSDIIDEDEPKVAREMPEGITEKTPVGEMPFIGPAIMEKLTANSISTAGQFLDLTYEQAVEICKSPLTPSRYKQYFKLSQNPQIL